MMNKRYIHIIFISLTIFLVCFLCLSPLAFADVDIRLGAVVNKSIDISFGKAQETQFCRILSDYKLAFFIRIINKISWLEISPNPDDWRGTFPRSADYLFRVNRQGLEPGVYYDDIIILTHPSKTPVQTPLIIVRVIMVVEPTNLSKEVISLNEALNGKKYDLKFGDNPQVKYVYVVNDTGSDIRFSTTDDAEWLGAESDWQQISYGEEKLLSFSSANLRSLLGAGTYTGKITMLIDLSGSPDRSIEINASMVISPKASDGNLAFFKSRPRFLCPVIRASSVYQGFSEHNLNNGSPFYPNGPGNDYKDNMIFADGDNKQNVLLKFDQAYNIEQILLCTTPNETARRPSKVSIDISLDGEKWTTIINSGAPTELWTIYDNLGGVSARLINFSFGPANGFGDRVCEIEIYQTAKFSKQLEPQKVNHPPIVGQQSISASEDTPVDITLTGSDPDGDRITFKVINQPSHGLLNGNPPNLIYQPNLGFRTTDIFTFIANDGTADGQPATITIKVNPATGSVVTGKDGSSMVLIPAGEFQMGGDDPSEKPVHKVYTDAFYMDVCEVTNAQYRRFMQATGRKEPEGLYHVNGSWGNWQPGFKPLQNDSFNDDNQPVVCVSWEDAEAYATWAGKRLPTEAEWEKAARGGLIGKEYPWGNEDPNGTQCNLADSSCINYDWAIKNINDGYQYTAPVGSFPPNGYGLYDMAGNVWEFCIDWYDPSYYTNPPKQNPTGPNSGTTRVMRGGSWLDPTFLYFSVSHHHSDSPKASWFGGGFRCVSSVTSSERRLSITPAEVAPGTQASVQLGINNATGITSGDILLKYDPKVITIGETKGTDLISNMTFIVNKDVSGELKLSMAGIEGIENGSGALIDIAFTANQSTRLNSETKLEFVYANFYDQSGKTIPVELENGIIKIIQGGIKGDVNGDNQVRSNDATLALRITAGLTTPTAYQLWAADMNNDGQVRSNDATLILRKAAGLLAPLNEPIVNGRNVIIGLNEVYGLAGNSITVPVKVDRADIIASGDVCIAYDSSILRAVDILSESDLLLVNNITESGMIRITFASADGLKSNTIANIKFEVLTDKVSPITFHKAELYRLDTTPIDSKTVNGRFQSLAMRPEHDGLLQNFPNPFNPETWIPYQLRNDSQVKIHIYTIKGELIRTLELGYKPAGIYSSQDRSAYWDGKNESGEYASSGVYFYTIKAGDFTATKKMIIQK